MNEIDRIKLVRDVFGQEPGLTLINELEEEISSDLYDDNPYKVYYKIGKLDLIRRLKNINRNADSIIEFITKHDDDSSNIGEM